MQSCNKCLMVLAVVICLVSYLANQIFYQDSQSLEFGQSKPTFLYVGIMSAREHFSARQVIRNTWLKSAIQDDNKDLNVQVKFIVGDQSCGIHVHNRKSAYSCEKHNFSMPINAENFPLYVPSLPQDMHKNITPKLNTQYWNASITVVHPIMMKRLGLHSAVTLKTEPISVIIYDDNREEKISEVQFSIANSGILIGLYRYHPIKPILLPRDFVGSIRILGVLQLNSTMTANPHIPILNSGGTLIVQYLDEFDFPVDSDDSSTAVFLASCYMSLFDEDAFKDAINKQHTLDENMKKTNDILSARLIQESEKYGDILFVHTLDVYRNLPQKVLKFHQWVQSNTFTDFVMKTDDDCYVDIKQISKLLTDHQGKKKLWWSNFRYNWFVEKFGKWAETSYRAETYPPFACGSGNIMSADLSSWLAQNAEFLKIYQGEDTSSGIWLSAIGPNYVNDKRWKCDKNCDSSTLVIPELNHQEMEWFWKNKMNCDDPCGC